MNLTENMELAIKLAKKAELEDEVPVGAVLIHDGKVIGEGRNRRENSGKTTGHAEIEAIEDYNHKTGQWRLPKDTALYVTVEPCMMCSGALLSARVDRVFYGASDPKGAGLSRFQTFINEGIFDHRFQEVQGGIAEEDCSQLISNYFRKKRGRSAANQSES